MTNINELYKLRNRAHANALRQRNREILKLPVRVSPTFWEQVENDYNRQINSAIELLNEELTKNKTIEL